MHCIVACDSGQLPQRANSSQFKQQLKIRQNTSTQLFAAPFSHALLCWFCCCSSVALLTTMHQHSLLHLRPSYHSLLSTGKSHSIAMNLFAAAPVACTALHTHQLVSYFARLHVYLYSACTSPTARYTSQLLLRSTTCDAGGAIVSVGITGAVHAATLPRQHESPSTFHTLPCTY